MNKELKIAYVSDLHLGFYVPFNYDKRKLKNNLISFVKKNLLTDADVFVLAGDVAEYNIYTIIVLEELSKHYKKVFFVFGNHDMYLLSTNQKKKYQDSYGRINEVIDYFKDNDNVYVLNRDIIEYNGFRIAGFSNWYTLENTMDEFFFLNDSNDSRCIYPKTIYENQQRHYYDKVFYDSLNEKDIDLIISHVPPIHFKSDRHEPNGCYYNKSIKEIHTKHWICGHQHVPSVVEIGDITVYNNAWGYPGEIKEPKLRTMKIVKNV